ncbi:MAG TPA: aerobic carbon-monoxide dehydrogenase large subunit [Anaerolineae bacterium]|nr:aerobic carbon-monoxide dehydrogenase large subunit [Anaerolineae bacterium]
MAEVHGLGHSRKRVEDARFLRGKGNYIDDLKLPGMLYLDIVRSPYAHAKILSTKTDKALTTPGVLAVIDGPPLQKYNVHNMPTLMSDTQMVLPIDKVKYQYQEVAGVLATDRYAAADVIVKENIYIPRIHVSSIETCGCVAQWNSIEGHLTLYMTTQAPHAIRTVVALITAHLGLSEEKIRIISPDIGGDFGGKVPAYPGYVIAVAASIVTGVPVKWIEDRTGNLAADSFARDYHIAAELGAKKDGTLTALKIKTIADHGYTDAAANPSKFPAGLFHICTGSYDLKHAFVEVDGVYTNKPLGGIAYRCSFRVTEAVHTIERMADLMAHELGMDPADFRLKNFIKPDQFPYKSALGWEYDSGNYAGALRKAMDMIGYEELRKEQAEKRARGELMGIGISSFTEIVGAGPSHTFDILGLKMFDSCEIRVHPTGKAIARFGTKSQGQGHETTYAQIIAEELGIPAEHIKVEEGDTDTAPYGLGTYASRSTPTAGAAAAIASRKIRDKAKKIAAHLLEAAEEDLVWEQGKFYVKGSPDRAKTIQDIAFAAYTNHPQGMEAGLEAVNYYDPPNLTYPFGSYICVVDIDRGTGQVKVRRFVAVDDCGTRINPMIVEGQIHGGLTMGFAPALMEEIQYDENGNIYGATFMDYMVPTAVETPRWETGATVTPSPHHPIGAKGVGESATVGAPAAIVNAVVDALWHLGVRHIDIPMTAPKVWQILHDKGAALEE